MTAPEQDRVRYPTVQRCWDILRLIAASRYGLTAKQIAAETGLSLRTVRRILYALEDVDIGVEWVTDRRNPVRRYRCPNFVILAKNAPRARYCRGCGIEIPTAESACSDGCRDIVSTRERNRATGGIPYDRVADDHRVPRGTWHHEHGRDHDGNVEDKL